MNGFEKFLAAWLMVAAFFCGIGLALATSGLPGARYGWLMVAFNILHFAVVAHGYWRHRQELAYWEARWPT